MDQEGILQLDMNVLMMILAMVSNVRIKYMYKNLEKNNSGVVLFKLFAPVNYRC